MSRENSGILPFAVAEQPKLCTLMEPEYDLEKFTDRVRRVNRLVNPVRFFTAPFQFAAA